jgi:hypothetical protein
MVPSVIYNTSQVFRAGLSSFSLFFDYAADCRRSASNARIANLRRESARCS